MAPFLQLFFLATILATSHCSQLSTHNQIHLDLRKAIAGGHHHPGKISCLSWRLGVETNNIIGWSKVPKECENYVGHYMLGHQYRADSKAVVSEAISYAESLNLPKDGRNIWIFDFDETSISNLPFLADQGFGAKVINNTLVNNWVAQAKAPALPESLKLYRKLLQLGIKIVFLTGRFEELRIPTTINLRKAGYKTWEKLILRSSSYPSNDTVRAFKSSEKTQLVEEGYRIVGNIGDQWSDILGANAGNRTFKLPNPMYYSI